jgi:hypothetical protein
VAPPNNALNAVRQQRVTIDLGCRLATYSGRKVGAGQRCCWLLNADPLGRILQALIRHCICGILILGVVISAPSAAVSEEGSSLLGVCNIKEHCLVTQDPSTGAYECLAPRNVCEEKFLEGGCKPDSCPREEGCELLPGRCFCPGGVECICGGGPPPSCRQSPTAS